MNWQDISTAPKDGTKILIASEESVTTAWWEPRLGLDGDAGAWVDFNSCEHKPDSWTPSQEEREYQSA